MALLVDPFRWWAGVVRLRAEVQLHVREMLQQTDEEERHLIVGELPNQTVA